MEESEKAREGGRRQWKGVWHCLPRAPDLTDHLTSGRPLADLHQGGDELSLIIRDAMANFMLSNPLHPDVFPGVRKMESEIVSMCLNL